MFTENNDGQSAEGQQSAESQQQGQPNPFDVFNEPTPVTSDDGDDIVFTDFSSTDENPEETPAQGSEEVKTPEQIEEEAANGEGNLEEINFEDDLAKSNSGDQTATEDDDEALIEKLKAKGYDVKKDEVSPQDQKDDIEIKRIDGVLSQANSFIAQKDDVIVREKLKSDLVKSYTLKGKQHLIGTEEFEIDLESEFSEYDDNPTMQKLFADNIRRDVKDVIAKNESEKEKITSKKQKELQDKIAQNRTSLQDGIKAIAKQGIFGVNVSPDEAKEIYKSITSGEFAKTVNSDPNLVAEFATYLKHRESITQKLGGPTYGEGVKAGIDALLGNSKKSSSTPLAQTIQKSSNGQGGNVNRKSAWGMPTIEKKENKDEVTQRVAGSGFL